MAWPPPLSSSPSATARRTALPRSTPRIERPEPVPVPPGSSAMAKAGRLNRSFSRAAKQPHHAGMPVRRRRHHHRALFLDAERGRGLGLRLLQHRHLHRAALAVQPVELGGDAPGLDRIVGAKQQRAEIGAADAAAGVDARAEQEAQVKRLGRARRAAPRPSAR